MRPELAFELRRAREARGISLRTLGRMAGISSSSLSRWELGSAAPNEEILGTLSQILRAPLSNSIQGKIEFKAVHKGALLRSLRVRGGMSLFDAAQQFGFSPSALSRWESGQRGANSEVVKTYAKAFPITDDELEALQTGQAIQPFATVGERQVETIIADLRNLRLKGVYGPLDLEYLAAEASLPKNEISLRMRLLDAYVERLEWEFRHQEATSWARRNLELARSSNDYSSVGRSIRAICRHMITDLHKEEEGLAYLADAMQRTKGLACEGVVVREAADRMAQAGRFSESWHTLQIAWQASLPEAREQQYSDCDFLAASIAIAFNRPKIALKTLSSARHPDPYMQSFLVQLEARARHALGDYVGCQSTLENGIQSLDQPGLRHFTAGLVERLKLISGKPYQPLLWHWKSSKSRALAV